MKLIFKTNGHGVALELTEWLMTPIADDAVGVFPDLPRGGLFIAHLGVVHVCPQGSF